MIFNFKADSKEFDSSSPFNRRLRSRLDGRGKKIPPESFEEHIKALRNKQDSLKQEADLSPHSFEKTESDET